MPLFSRQKSIFLPQKLTRVKEKYNLDEDENWRVVDAEWVTRNRLAKFVVVTQVTVSAPYQMLLVRTRVMTALYPTQSTMSCIVVSKLRHIHTTVNLNSWNGMDSRFALSRAPGKKRVSELEV